MDARQVLVVSVSLLACAPADGVGAEGDDESTGPIDLPTPDFLEPVGGELHLDVTRTGDVTLDVNADVGVTRLIVDGASVGTLSTTSSVGEFDAGELRLFVRGAMVAGIHFLQLRTPDTVETESSEVVTVILDGVVAPALRWTAGPLIDQGDALVLGGGEDGTALGLVVSEPTGSHVVVRPPGAAGWDPGRTRTVALPGYFPTGTTAAVAVTHRVEGDDERLRVAWRIGAPGAAVGIVEVDWATADNGVPIVGFAPDRAWLGAREYTEIGAPTLAGDLVLVEVTALVDSERPHPGDRTLAIAPWSSTALILPQLLPLGAVDIDGAVLALDSLPGSRTSIGMRLDRVAPGVIEVENSTGALGVRATSAAVEDPRWNEIEGPLVTALGAFRSRIVAGLHRDRNAVLVGWIDDSGSGEADARWVDLPADTIASGPLALALIGGAAVVLVPRGEFDLVAITTTSTAPKLQVLPGAPCDAVAAGFAADATAEIEVACLQGRELTMGLLALESSRAGVIGPAATR